MTRYIIIIGLFIFSPIRLIADQICDGSDPYISCGWKSKGIGKDTFEYKYKNYTIWICNKMSRTGGNMIIIDTNKVIKKLPFEGAQYFYGLVGDNMIIDIGTSTLRDFELYDLKTLKVVFSSRYTIGMSTKDSVIFFHYPFLNSEEIIDKPDCPEKDRWESQGGSAGYVEERGYDLKAHKLNKVGTVRCKYFE
jgi:hypothetical protein